MNTYSLHVSRNNMLRVFAHQRTWCLGVFAHTHTHTHQRSVAAAYRRRASEGLAPSGQAAEALVIVDSTESID